MGLIEDLAVTFSHRLASASLNDEFLTHPRYSYGHVTYEDQVGRPPQVRIKPDARATLTLEGVDNSPAKLGGSVAVLSQPMLIKCWGSDETECLVLIGHVVKASKSVFNNRSDGDIEWIAEDGRNTNDGVCAVVTVEANIQLPKPTPIIVTLSGSLNGITGSLTPQSSSYAYDWSGEPLKESLLTSSL